MTSPVISPAMSTKVSATEVAFVVYQMLMVSPSRSVPSGTPEGSFAAEVSGSAVVSGGSVVSSEGVPPDGAAPQETEVRRSANSSAGSLCFFIVMYPFR